MVFSPVYSYASHLKIMILAELNSEGLMPFWVLIWCLEKGRSTWSNLTESTYGLEQEFLPFQNNSTIYSNERLN